MIRVLIADDHAIVRRGLRQILEGLHGGVAFGESATAADVLGKIRAEKWDIVILDIALPDASGLDVLKQIRAERPKVPVMVLSMHSEEQYALRVLKAGAAGYLTKESAPEQLVAAVNKVAGGGKYVSSALAERMAADLEKGAEEPFHKGLSDREFQVLCRIAAGKTVSEIADEMSISVKTVSTYRTRLLEKMRMKTNADLTRYALESKLVQ